MQIAVFFDIVFLLYFNCICCELNIITKHFHTYKAFRNRLRRQVARTFGLLSPGGGRSVDQRLCICTEWVSRAVFAKYGILPFGLSCVGVGADAV